jgi:hypothetical protein
MKPYFTPFPTIFYDSFINTEEIKLVTDIFKRSKATTESIADRVVWYDYVVLDGETPESIAYNYYDSVNYHWVILLTNQIQDPQWDWPMSGKVFDKYISKKYGSIVYAKDTTSHYETIEIIAEQNINNDSGNLYKAGDVVLKAGQIVDSTFSYTASGIQTWIGDAARKLISIYDKEEADNEAKRSIVLLKPEFLAFFVEEFESLTVKKR